MTNPIMKRLGSVFIPVSNIEEARTWYSKVLGISEELEILFGHLCVIPREGQDLILDEMPMWHKNGQAKPSAYPAPAITFLTEHLKQSYEWIKANGADLVTDIMDDHWFVFKDPDGNMIMVCHC